MRHIILAPLILAAAAVPAAAEFLRVSPGQAVQFELPENPSTGFSWRIETQASEGMDHVSIADDGYKPGAEMPGAPGLHVWTVKGVKRGKAMVRFVYQRPWEPAAAERRTLEVTVGP